MLIKHKYPSVKQVIEGFNIQSVGVRRQNLGIKTLKDALICEYPTLNDLKQVYCEEAARSLVNAYLVSLCQMCNITTFTPEQTDVCEELIYEKLKSEKISIVHEFFKRILSAHYGDFYGSLQITTLMSYCTAFVNDVRRKRREIAEEVVKAKREARWREADERHKAKFARNTAD